ncbi:MAG: class I SAM-dependent methyltransferase [Candidatus Riflebacteria bacterium]|nr:class I SAM-dependent methyltransferase [Candidatus Riflebacteria bacterium]
MQIPIHRNYGITENDPWSGKFRKERNVTFTETNGVDFHNFQDEFFDFIFSTYVYQHVLSSNVIEANLTDAYRVLKPGGVFKSQTNGVTNEEFRLITKDTWTGDTFSEIAVRSLAVKLGAQMLSVLGSDTQYCWSVWRKALSSPSRKGIPSIKNHE